MNKIKVLLNNKYIQMALFGMMGVVIGMLIIEPRTSNSHEGHGHELEETAPGVWTCSMHPQIKMDKPGKCPICAMDLIPLRSNSGGAHGAINPDAIQLSEEAVALANIRTSSVTRGNSSKEIRLYGKIAVDERGVQSQTAHVSGRIEALQIDYTGQNVRKGEIIARLYSPDLMNAQQELLVAVQTGQQSLISAVREKLRHWKMTDDQIAEIEKNEKVMASVPVKATTSGFVTAKNVSQGDYVNAGDVLFEIANLYQVWAVFEAYEADLPYLKQGEALDFQLQAVPGRSFSGKIAFVDPVLNPATRTTRVRVDVPNADLLLKPEMYAMATVQASVHGNSQNLIIPESAVLWTGKRSVVYVKEPGVSVPAYTMREVTLGEKLQGMYVVTDGLTEHDEIVTNGTFTLDASAQLEGKPSMMNAETGTSDTGNYVAESMSVSGSCEMCKERIETTAKGVNGVKNAAWNPETKELNFRFDPNTTDRTEIARQIAAVGHDNDFKKADATVYENLPECCKYR